MASEYSPIWFDTFLSPTGAAPVDRELEFIQKHLPVLHYPKLLDVGCGIGRHAGALASVGYDVVGIDRSPHALEVARREFPGAKYHLLDVRDLDRLDHDFDGVLCLWQSFGFGTATENLDLLRTMAARLRPEGRLLLDIYNADALIHLPRESTETRAARTIHTRRELEGGRLCVRIRYSDSDDVDVYDWMVYTPSTITEAARSVGLVPMLSCAWFDETMAPSGEHQRMQLLCELG